MRFLNNHPSVFIIGASKAGTTFLHTCLVQHPSISDVGIKEPFFFSDPNYLHRLQWYKDIYADCDCDKLSIDSSPTYSEVLFFKNVPSRIYAWNNDCKIIYVVREPFSRIASVWRQNLNTGHHLSPKYYGFKMSKDFKTALYNYPSLLDATRYWSNLKVYLKFFPHESIKVVLFEDLISEPHECLSDIFKFLCIDNKFEVHTEKAVQNNGSGKAIANPWISRIRQIFPSIILDNIPPYFKIKARSLVRRLPVSVSDIPSSELSYYDAARLKAILTPEVVGIYEYLAIKNDPWRFFE
jgi:hypothetical protein